MNNKFDLKTFICETVRPFLETLIDEIEIAFDIPEHINVQGMLGENFLGHKFKSGHLQCKTQTRQNNWVGTPHKGPNSHPPFIGVSVPVDQNIDF